MRRNRLARVMAIIAVLGSLVAPSVVRASTPPSLTGEFLVASPVDITATCSETGTSTISYSASGLAFGPYAGTFTEVGTVTIGQTPPTPAQFVNGFPLTRVATLVAFFTIDSEAGQVTGTKRLIVESDQVLGLCFDFTDRQLPGGPTVSGTFRRVCACPFGLFYEAMIKTESGTFGDEGQSGLVIEEFQVTAADPPGSVTPTDVFNEGFASFGTVVPLAGVGHATGGGQIDPAIAFGFEVRSNGGLKGGCTLIDHASDIKIKCLDVTAFAQTGNRVVFSGMAEVNGQPTHYRIEAVDETEPGQGFDQFSIQTASGYTASGVLAAGNLQVHT